MYASLEIGFEQRLHVPPYLDFIRRQPPGTARDFDFGALGGSGAGNVEPKLDAGKLRIRFLDLINLHADTAAVRASASGVVGDAASAMSALTVVRTSSTIT